MRNIIPAILMAIFFASCTKSEVILPEKAEKELSLYENEVISYFQEVALGFEFGNASEVTRKWDSDMKIFVGEKPTPTLLAELDKVKNEINVLASDGFKIDVVSDSSQSNYYLFFGSNDAYATIFPSQKNNAQSNWGLFSVFWNGRNNLNRGYMYVDLYRPTIVAQKHLLREELTQSLGLARDSEKYEDSIFQQRWTLTNTYTDIDKELIRLLYHPDMPSGLSAQEVKQVLTMILKEEKNRAEVISTSAY